MKKRETALLELLAENGKMEVAALAEKLETSQVTIRKDLDALEKRGGDPARAWLCNLRRFG